MGNAIPLRLGIQPEVVLLELVPALAAACGARPAS